MRQVLRIFGKPHRDRLGVESIYRVLPITPAGYRSHAVQQRKPTLQRGRIRRDDALIPEIQHVWDANRQCCGAAWVWKQLWRKSIKAASRKVKSLMYRVKLQSIRRTQVS